MSREQMERELAAVIYADLRIELDGANPDGVILWNDATRAKLVEAAMQSIRTLTEEPDIDVELGDDPCSVVVKIGRPS